MTGEWRVAERRRHASRWCEWMRALDSSRQKAGAPRLSHERADLSAQRLLSVLTWVESPVPPRGAPHAPYIQSTRPLRPVSHTCPTNSTKRPIDHTASLPPGARRAPPPRALVGPGVLAGGVLLARIELHLFVGAGASPLGALIADLPPTRRCGPHPQRWREGRHGGGQLGEKAGGGARAGRASRGVRGGGSGGARQDAGRRIVTIPLLESVLRSRRET